MNNPKNLPIATGASLGSGGSDKPESITVDPGNAPRIAAEPAIRSTPMPPPATPVPEAKQPVNQPSPEVVETTKTEYQVTDEEIDQLHSRFDNMEALIKRRLAVATLHARFDALEKWLNDRF